ncbi:hypothetical protein C621_0217895 [Bacillus thuringiensis serovar aizawai str. Leapi01]|nr:hypothetical protein C621_0217895 [Bacillus thuringiensis serovar aizawai str. Leapi01]ETE97812.1 hypothetical protein C623_0212445 [Bacillus thuringiensis serovar aizawai str. Hu4-2]KLA16160.1 hypothetical protein B4158_2559 [Bacillus cereus]
MNKKLNIKASLSEKLLENKKFYGIEIKVRRKTPREKI